jgi:ABC-type transport system involved in multi-copper enzyme maturation permease subunit
MHPSMPGPVLGEIAPEYLLFGGAAIVSVLAFAMLILVPAIGSYGRTWEKATAALLSVFVLAALVLAGIAIGVAIVYFWEDITDFLL